MAVETHLPAQAKEIHYPDSDGQPMADNTVQYAWIEKIKGGCEALFAGDPNVFVAGELLWYPVEGHPEIRIAPDVLVTFGCPKGDCGSYKQWEEGGVAPQVVFEILSPGNRLIEMLRKLQFYERHGAEEYYIYNPTPPDLSVLLRQGERLVPVEFIGAWVSPRLGVRFELPEAGGMTIYRPDGRPFQSYVEIERERAEVQARAERLATRLRELGLEPNEPSE
jgi:Uma2 family endonuclease